VGRGPVLGYDVEPRTCKLIVNETESKRVRAIYELYLRREALAPLVDELAKRGWANKRWMTRKGRERGGKAFTKSSLHKLLTNVTYLGKVRHKKDVYDGEHDAILDPALWQQVNGLLRHNGHTAGAAVRNKFGALLKGLLWCVPCGCRMTPTHATNGTTRYRYYRCSNPSPCPSRSIPAPEIERFVVEQLRGFADDPANPTTNDLDQVRLLLGQAWDTLPPREQVRAVRLLVERVDYDGGSGQISTRVRPDGIGALARDWAEREETA
jgi:site-specific DNA recombinase